MPRFHLPVALAIIIGSNLSNLESWRVKSWKTWAYLPWFNVYLFFVGFVGTAVGLLTGKQRYTQRN